MKRHNILSIAGCLALAMVLSWIRSVLFLSAELILLTTASSQLWPRQLDANGILQEAPRDTPAAPSVNISEIESQDQKRSAVVIHAKRAPPCRSVSPFQTVFELCNFPGSDGRQPLTNDEEFVATMMMEAFSLLWSAHLTMQNMNELSASFRRYFQDEDFNTVKQVFSSISDQLGLTTGLAGNPNWTPQCVRQSHLLPFKIYYGYGDRAYEDFCEQHSDVAAYMSTYKGAPGTDNSVPQYMVVCPSMLSSSIRDPVMNAPPRRLEDADLPFLLADSFASARGYGQNFPSGGMMSSATHVAHEFIHWKDAYQLDQVDLVEDQTFSPAGWTKRITAYSAWQSQELRRVKPELCVCTIPNT